MKRVLITGARGFIGRNCLEPVTRRGYEVHAAGRRPFDPGGDFTFHEIDLLDQQARTRLLKQVRPTHLLDAAWDLTVPDYMSSPHNYQWVAASLDLTREFAGAGGKRALYIGSCYEYSWDHPVLDDRATPLVPATHYGKAKAGLFQLITNLAQATDLSIAWSRLFFLYGPFESPRRLVPHVITRILSGREAPTTHGRQERDYMYSLDVGDALVALLDSEVEGAVNIGTGSAPPIADLVQLAAELCGHPELLRLGAIKAKRDEAPRVVAAIDRLRSEVGWENETPMEEALAQTIEWWRGRLPHE